MTDLVVAPSLTPQFAKPKNTNKRPPTRTAAPASLMDGWSDDE